MLKLFTKKPLDSTTLSMRIEKALRPLKRIIDDLSLANEHIDEAIEQNNSKVDEMRNSIATMTHTNIKLDQAQRKNQETIAKIAKLLG